MASLASIVTISAAQTTRYVECGGCRKTVALAPKQTQCQPCRNKPKRATRRPVLAA